MLKHIKTSILKFFQTPSERAEDRILLERNSKQLYRWVSKSSFFIGSKWSLHRTHTFIKNAFIRYFYYTAFIVILITLSYASVEFSWETSVAIKHLTYSIVWWFLDYVDLIFFYSYFLFLKIKHFLLTRMWNTFTWRNRGFDNKSDKFTDIYNNSIFKEQFYFNNAFADSNTSFINKEAVLSDLTTLTSNGDSLITTTNLDRDLNNFYKSLYDLNYLLTLENETKALKSFDIFTEEFANADTTASLSTITNMAQNPYIFYLNWVYTSKSANSRKDFNFKPNYSEYLTKYQWIDLGANSKINWNQQTRIYANFFNCTKMNFGVNSNDWLRAYNTLFLKIKNTREIEDIYKQKRWLYRYSTLHRQVINGSLKSTTAKILASSGFYDSTLFNKNLWAMTQTHNIDDKFINNFSNILYKTWWEDTFQKKTNNFNGANTLNVQDSFKALRFTESSYYWLLKRYYFSNTSSKQRFSNYYTNIQSPQTRNLDQENGLTDLLYTVDSANKAAAMSHLDLFYQTNTTLTSTAADYTKVLESIVSTPKPNVAQKLIDTYLWNKTWESEFNLYVLRKISINNRNVSDIQVTNYLSAPRKKYRLDQITYKTPNNVFNYNVSDYIINSHKLNAIKSLYIKDLILWLNINK